jgi:hypothetical protein
LIVITRRLTPLGSPWTALREKCDVPRYASASAISANPSTVSQYLFTLFRDSVTLRFADSPFTFVGVRMPFAKWILAIAVAIGISASASSADPPAKPPAYSIEGMDEYVPMLTKFLELISKGEIENAYGQFGKLKSPQEDPEFYKGLDELKKRLIVLKEQGGGYSGCEVSAVKPITSRLHKVYIVCTYELKPILFSFVMYKPGKEWQCRDVDYGSKIDDFLESYPLVTDLKKK